MGLDLRAVLNAIVDRMCLSRNTEFQTEAEKGS